MAIFSLNVIGLMHVPRSYSAIRFLLLVNLTNTAKSAVKLPSGIWRCAYAESYRLTARAEVRILDTIVMLLNMKILSSSPRCFAAKYGDVCAEFYQLNVCAGVKFLTLFCIP